MTNLEVKNKMNELKTYFSDGKYWNHSPCDPNDPWSVTNYPCDHINNGICGCNSFGNKYQETAFAIFMASLIFGSYPTLENQNGEDCNGWKTYICGFSDLIIEPGDIIRTKNPEHSAIVYEVNDPFFTVAEVWGNPANVSSNCIIKWGYFNGSANNTLTNVLSNAKYIQKAPKTPSNFITV